MTPLGHHGLSCSRSVGRHPRHRALNEVISRAFRSAGIASQLEPTGLSRSSALRPDGMTLTSWTAGRPLVWDAVAERSAECRSERASSVEAIGSHVWESSSVSSARNSRSGSHKRKCVGDDILGAVDAPTGDIERVLAEISEGIFVASEDRCREQTDAEQSYSSGRHRPH